MIFDYWIQTTNDFIIKNIDFIDDFEKFYKTSNIEIYVDISTFFSYLKKNLNISSNTIPILDNYKKNHDIINRL